MKGKLLYITLAVIFLGAFAFGVFYFLQTQKLSSRNNPPATFSTETERQSSTQLTAEQRQLLLAMGTSADKPLVCNTQTPESLHVTLYLANFKAKFGYSESLDSPIYNVLIDGDMTHVWIDGAQTGYKIKTSLLATGSTSDSVIFGKFFSIDPNTFTCRDWKLINGVFELPEEVNFQNFNP